MAVKAVSGDQAYCEWLAGGEQRQGTFALVTLVPDIECFTPDGGANPVE